MDSFSTTTTNALSPMLLKGTKLLFPTIGEAVFYFALVLFQIVSFSIWIWYLFWKRISRSTSIKTINSSSSIHKLEMQPTRSNSVKPNNSRNVQQVEIQSASSPSSANKSTAEFPTIENAIAIYQQNQSMGHRGVKIPVSAKILSSLAISFGIIWQIFLAVIPYFGGSCFAFSLIWVIGILSRCFLYGYYLMRIQITFEGSIYKISNNRFKCLLIWFSVSYTIIVLFSIFYLNFDQCSVVSVVIIVIPAALNEQCVSVVCLFLFVRKLRKIVSDMRSRKANQQLNTLRHLITKLTILACVTVSSGFFAVFLGCIEFVCFDIFSMALGYIGLDMLINNLCLMLSFAFTSTYYQYLCMPCRFCCEKKALSHQ